MRRWIYLVPPILVPLLVFLPRITGGAFTIDDWSNRSIMTLTDRQGIIDGFLADPLSHRALHLPYVMAYDAILGSHQRAYLLWGVLTAALLGVLIAVLLRRSGVPAWVASAIATLGVIYPYASVTKIWATAHVGHVTGALAVGGILIALRGLRARRRAARVAWHALAMLLFLASLNLYEIALPIVCAGGVFYLVAIYRQDPRPVDRRIPTLLRTYRPALLRWIADLAMTAAWYASLSSTDIAKDTTYSTGERLTQILSDGAQNIAGTFAPFLKQDARDGVATIYSGAWLTTPVVVGVVVAVVLFAVACMVLPALVGRADRPRHDAAVTVRRWGIGIALAIAAAYAGWIAIVPANAYYRPLPYDSSALRVNVLAAFGLAAVFVCTVGGAAALLRMLVGPGRGARAGTALVTVALIAISVAYTRHVRSEIALWNTASTEQIHVLGAVKTALEDDPPEPGSTVFLTDNRNFVEDGAEVFHNSWGFRSALRIMFHDPTLDGIPGREAAAYQCRRNGLAPFYLQYQYGSSAAAEAPYGKTFLVSTTPPRKWLLHDRRSCRRALKAAGLTEIPAGEETPELGTT